MSKPETKEDLFKKIERMLPSSDAKCNLVLTMLGCAAQLTVHINNTSKMSALPIEVIYCMGITASNMAGFTQNDEASMRDLNDTPISISLAEQGQEEIFRKIKLINEELTAYIKEKESV